MSVHILFLIEDDFTNYNSEYSITICYNKIILNRIIAR